MKNEVLGNRKLIAVGMLGALLLLAGCATTAPKADFAKGMALATRVASADEIKVRVETEKELNLLDAEKARLAQRIEERIAAKKSRNTTGSEKRNYEVEVTLNRYDKGNAFARAMLAGLGQIHIDGVVRLYELPDKKKVGEFTVKKTFAWGGIYGASTNIEDIERTFADGIAAAVT